MLRLYGWGKSRYLSLTSKNEPEAEYPIDFVITWVDGSDPDWQREKQKYASHSREETLANPTARYRDWGFLPYWFRAVEKYAPWVHRVYFVTNGQRPKWLNLQDEKLVFVTHEEFIPAEYLPTFCSDVIELNLWRINGLSEHFVYFNDDVFLNRPVSAAVFFRNSLPKACSLARPVHLNLNSSIIWYQRHLNDYAAINTYLDIRKAFVKNPEKFFSHIYGREIRYNLITYYDRTVSSMVYTHSAYPFLKATFQELWDRCGSPLDESCRRKFRSSEDFTIFLPILWQIFTGNYSPVPSGYFGYTINMTPAATHKGVRCMTSEECRIVCLNDSEVADNESETARRSVRDVYIQAFERKFPKKSRFEV